MADFGFEPVNEGARYFISYAREDSARVREIIRCLIQAGVPLWYEHGLTPGIEWSSQINREIIYSDAYILFVTKNLLAKVDNYVRKEYRIATLIKKKGTNEPKKKIFVVWLDHIEPEAVNIDLLDWYLDLADLQGMEIFEKKPEEIAQKMIGIFQLIHGLPSQPIDSLIDLDTVIDVSVHMSKDLAHRG